MVSTKRQIMRDRDRFGGYAEDDSRVKSETRADVYDAYETEPQDITSSHSYDGRQETFISDEMSDISIKRDAAAAAPAGQSMLSQSTAPVMSERRTAESVPTYTTAPTYAAAPSVQEKPLYTRQPVELPPRPAKERKVYDKEDIMPSIKTRSYAQGAAADEPTAAESAAPVREARQRRALDSRTKVMLVVYVAVALVLAIAVIATGVSISQTSAEVSALTETIAQKQQIVDTQNERIDALTDNGHIRDEAMHRGMVDADSSITVNRAESVDYPEAEVHTNGFDEFCDALDNIIM